MIKEFILNVLFFRQWQNKRAANTAFLNKYLLRTVSVHIMYILCIHHIRIILYLTILYYVCTVNFDENTISEFNSNK